MEIHITISLPMTPTFIPKANHLGGDLSGVEQKIFDGYLDSLGINTIWISPITQNPDSAFGLWTKGITSEFSAYHGYWPISSTEVDYRFGTEDDLRSLIDTAHEHDMEFPCGLRGQTMCIRNTRFISNILIGPRKLYLPDGTLNNRKVGRT